MFPSLWDILFSTRSSGTLLTPFCFRVLLSHHAPPADHTSAAPAVPAAMLCYLFGFLFYLFIYLFLYADILPVGTGRWGLFGGAAPQRDTAMEVDTCYTPQPAPPYAAMAIRARAACSGECARMSARTHCLEVFTQPLVSEKHGRREIGRASCRERV